MSSRAMVVLAAALLLGSAVPSSAQYFGRNKVQYEKFDFKVLTTEHFDIYYYPEEEAAVRLAARMAERWYVRLSTVLHHELNGRQPIIFYAAHPHFEQTNILGEIGEGTGGVTESNRRRVILPFAGGLAETDHVLGHELTHAFQYDIGSQMDVRGRPAGPGIEALPLWFIEGMAEYVSLGPIDSNTAMWVRDAASRDAMPTIDKLDDPDFFPYRYGHAFWAYVAGRWGDRVVGDLLRAAGPDGNLKAAIAAILGMDDKQLSEEWHAATKKAFAAVYETARPADAFGRVLISKEHGGGDMNVTPSISHDGKKIVFLSEKSMFSIDMYVAEVANGRILRKLVQTTSDPHFDSLQFIASAGDWAPDNRRFVFAALHAGQPVLTIVDTDSGRRESELEFKDIGEIYNPAWSPDGKRIAFSALKGGVLDLFLYSLDTKQLQQLTNDPFADLDPEWSPDGRELIFVTDRFSSNLESLSFGNYRIGAMTPGGQPREYAGFATGRNSNPEFASDGSLYFLATPDGIPNVYRLQNPSRGGTPARVTNVISGVAGITPLTPALSVSASGALVFTVFESDKYNIYATDTSHPATVGALATANRNNAELPPSNRRPDVVEQQLESSTTGLPQPRQYESEDYKAKLSLEGISQPTVGIGADRFGTYAAGGISMVFSDILNDHMIGATIQSTSRISETGAQAVYLNRKSRWNWGAVVEHVPYVTGQYAQGVGTDASGQAALVQETVRVTQLNSGASAIAQYPFSRVQRVEFAAGVRRIGFNAEVETDYFSPVTGDLFDRQKESLPHPGAINLGEATAALVYDSSVFGATSPLVGRRYRVEYSQETGTLTYGGFLADYRRYFMPARPFTFALRGMHYGRYGSGAEDPRLTPLFLGYQGLVRGYDFGSFTADECESTDMRSCPAFDRLNGSRVAIGNAELRFPLLGVFSRKSYYGPFPIEMALFADAGVAWTSATKPAFAGGERDWARSAGAAMRINVFGFAVAEIDYVRPFDRSRRGWLWQFGLTPGF